MYPDKQTELLDTIFRAFPSASIIPKSETKPLNQTESITKANSELAKRKKPRRAVSRACKHNVVDSRQLSLFNETKRGGI